MEGFLLFDGRNQLSLAHSRGPHFRRLLLQLQSELWSGETECVGGGGSERALSSGLSSGFEEEEVGSGSEEGGPETALSLPALSQAFLPLLILWRAKAAFDGDPYESIASHGVTWRFQPFADQSLVVYVSQGGGGRTDGAAMVTRLLSFSLGHHVEDERNRGLWEPTLSALLHRWDARGAESEAKPAGGLERDIWASASLDWATALSCRERNAGDSLRSLSGELEVFVEAEALAVIAGGSLVALHYAHCPPSQRLDPSDVFLLTQLVQQMDEDEGGASSAGSVGGGSSVSGDARHWLVWLGGEEGRRLPWDVLVRRVGGWTYVVALSTALGSPIAAQCMELHDRLAGLAREAWRAEEVLADGRRKVQRIAEALAALAVADSGSFRLTRGREVDDAGSLMATWEPLEDLLSELLRDPARRRHMALDRASGADIFGARSVGKKAFLLDARLHAAKAQLCGLVAKVTRKAFRTALANKMELFHRSWLRCLASKARLAALKNLRRLGSELHAAAPSAEDLGLHPVAYYFRLHRTQRYLLRRPESSCESSDTLLGAMARLVSECPSPSSSSVRCVWLPEGVGLAVSVGGEAWAGRGEALLGRLGRLVSGRRRRTSLSESLTGLEPLLCVAMFEPFVHPNLALSQTLALATRLSAAISPLPSTSARRN